MSNNLNVDLSPPINDIASRQPLDLANILNGKIPTFWLDGQVLDDETFEYSEPLDLPGYTPIHVPKVVRFIYAFDKTDRYVDNGNPDPPTGGGGNNKTVKWKVVQTVPLQAASDFYQFRIYWEKTGDVQIPLQVSYVRSHPPSDPGSFSNREIELPYGDYPNYSNDGG